MRLHEMHCSSVQSFCCSSDGAVFLADLASSPLATTFDDSSQFVSILAGRSTCMLNTNTFTLHDIINVSRRFEMSGIDACTSATKMIECQPFGDGPDEQRVSQTVGFPRSPLVSEHSVSAFVLAGCPNPTFASFVNLGPETFGKRFATHGCQGLSIPVAFPSLPMHITQIVSVLRTVTTIDGARCLHSIQCSAPSLQENSDDL